MTKTLLTLSLIAAVVSPALANTSGLTAKQAYELREMQQHNAIAARAAKEAKRSGFLPVNMHAPAIPTGIIQSGMAPVRGYNFVNLWQGVMNGQQVNVYAGSLRGNSRQGVLVVMAANHDLTWTQPRVIMMPVNSGPAKLIGSIGTTLKVATTSGFTMTFSVPNPASLPNVQHGRSYQ